MKKKESINDIDETHIIAQLKEQLRSILHMKNLDLAALELDKWLERAKECVRQAWGEDHTSPAEHPECGRAAVEQLKE